MGNRTIVLGSKELKINLNVTRIKNFSMASTCVINGFNIWAACVNDSAKKHKKIRMSSKFENKFLRWKNIKKIDVIG